MAGGGVNSESAFISLSLWAGSSLVAGVSLGQSFGSIHLLSCSTIPKGQKHPMKSDRRV